MDTKKLLLPEEVDKLLRYPAGRSERLAKRGKLPHILLPDGAIRFDSDVIVHITTGDHTPDIAGEGRVE